MFATFLAYVWDKVVRFRVWVVGLGGSFIVLVLPLLGAPEIMALLTPDQQKWVLAAAFVLNIWLRPRPALRAHDDEVAITKLRKGLK